MPGSIMRALAAVAALELPLVLLAAPAMLFPTPERLLIAFAIPLTWICRRALGQRWIPPTPFNLSILLLLLMIGVSVLATYDANVSLGKISAAVLGVLLFWAVARAITTTRRMALGIAGFLAAGSSLALIGLLGTKWFDKFPLLAPVIAQLPKAIRGVPGAEEGFQPNAVAGCLVLFLPLQATLLISRRARHVGPWSRTSRWIVGAECLALVLTAGTLLLTQSRGAWAGMLAAALAFLAWHGRRTRLAAATLAVGLVIAGAAIGPGQMFDLAVSRSGPGTVDNVIHRVDLWSRALAAIQDFPLTGMGMNTFRTVMPALYPMSTLPSGLDVAHAHNHLLQAALDLGLPGLIAYLSIWIQTGILLVKTSRGSTDPLVRTIAAGLAAGLVAHFSFSLTDAIPLGTKVGVLFWLTLAMVAALHKVSSGGLAQRLREPSEPA